MNKILIVNLFLSICFVIGLSASDTFMKPGVGSTREEALKEYLFREFKLSVKETKVEKIEKIFHAISGIIAKNNQQTPVNLADQLIKLGHNI